MARKFGKGDRIVFTHDDGREIEAIVTIAKTKNNAVVAKELTGFGLRVENPDGSVTWEANGHIYQIPLTVEKYNIRLVAKRS